MEPMDADMARMLRFVGDVQFGETVDDEVIEEQVDDHMLDMGGESGE